MKFSLFATAVAAFAIAGTKAVKLTQPIIFEGCLCCEDCQSPNNTLGNLALPNPAGTPGVPSPTGVPGLPSPTGVPGQPNQPAIPGVVPSPSGNPMAPNATGEKGPDSKDETKELDPETLNAVHTVDSIRRGILALREAKAEAFEKTKGMANMTKAVEEEKKKEIAETIETAKTVAFEAPVVTIKEVYKPLRPRPITGQMKAAMDACISKALEECD